MKGTIMLHRRQEQKSFLRKYSMFKILSHCISQRKSSKMWFKSAHRYYVIKGRLEKDQLWRLVYIGVYSSWENAKSRSDLNYGGDSKFPWGSWCFGEASWAQRPPVRDLFPSGRCGISAKTLISQHVLSPGPYDRDWASLWPTHSETHMIPCFSHAY